MNHLLDDLNLLKNKNLSHISGKLRRFTKPKRPPSMHLAIALTLLISHQYTIIYRPSFKIPLFKGLALNALFEILGARQPFTMNKSIIFCLRN